MRFIFKNKKSNSLKISISSPKQILIFSSGEIKNFKTLDYRDFIPEPEGLFCNKIYGSLDLEKCFCGKLSGLKNINKFCSFCKTQVLDLKSSRNKMGHFFLNDSFFNTLFFKSSSSFLSLFLNISYLEIKNILYNNFYLVLFSSTCKLKLNQVLSYKDYLYYYKYYRKYFYANTGFKAIIEALKYFSISSEINFLKNKFLKNVKFFSEEYNKNLKRYKMLVFLKNNFSIENIILNYIPVLSPQLRPIVVLPDGCIISSDLNDLYKRVMIKNLRLKKFFELNSPEIVINNERRILQESINSLFNSTIPEDTDFKKNNFKKKKLKCLMENLKGKFGYFRQNLLGKRVDFSARSVIISGPFLNLGECGLPLNIALDLFRPFIYNKLIFLKNINIKVAKKLVDAKSYLAVEILRVILKNHLVLLNRAPTLHKLGIQAFKAILTNDKAIKLHPLVCSAFNADFDGDQMAVHIPLSNKVNTEFKTLLLSNNNILHPSNGECCITPTQDIVLGLYYSTRLFDLKKNNYMFFNNFCEVKTAYEVGLINLNSKIFYKTEDLVFNELKNKIIETSLGRILIFEIMPKGFSIDDFNKVYKKKDISDILSFVNDNFGSKSVVLLSNLLMKIGFECATKSGISISIDDMIIYKKKNKIIDKCKKLVLLTNIDYLNGLLSYFNRRKRIIDIWELSSELIANLSIENLYFNKFLINNKIVSKESFNSLYLMIDSGARGSETQIKQICGLRGLMHYKKQGIMEVPVLNSLREGLSCLEYFYFSHSSRKTLADTALKTSNAGYLTRRLVEISNNIIISEYDCKTLNGITFRCLIHKGTVIENFYDRILGRVFTHDYFNLNNILIFYRNTIVTKEVLKKIILFKIDNIIIRSPVTCASKKGICSLCYGFDLSKNTLVSIGEPVGIIAAQSIGEPGTQLTMRTFHTGGAISKNFIDSTIYSNFEGIVEYSSSLKYSIKNDGSKIVVSNVGGISIKNLKNEELEFFRIPYSSLLLVNNNIHIKSNQAICYTDTSYRYFISPDFCCIKLVNFIENLNYIKRIDFKTDILNFEILNYPNKNSYIPLIKLIFLNKSKSSFITYKPSFGSYILVNDSKFLNTGDIIVKYFLNTESFSDITGGLPRVADIFEARSPKNKSILSPIDCIASFFIFKKNKYLIFKGFDGKIFKKKILLNKNIYNINGELLNKGDILYLGDLDPHDILSIYGINNTCEFFLTEIKSVYYSQGVKINDKHIEVILKQMLKSVVVTDKGSGKYITGSVLFKKNIISMNKKILFKKGSLIKYNPILTGITKSSLNSESFLCSLSFQETKTGLCKSSIFSEKIYIKYLKENILLGQVMPAGTGFYSKIFKNAYNKSTY